MFPLITSCVKLRDAVAKIRRPVLLLATDIGFR
jgi:hypothetical protein